MFPTPRNSLFYLILQLFLIQYANAQFKGAYHIGSIGNTGLQQHVFSGPVVFNDSSCVTISNGIRTFKHRINLVAFQNPCEQLNQGSETILFSSFPNPFTSSVTIKPSSSIPFQKNNTSAQLYLVDVSGRILKEITTGLMDLNGGYKMNLDNLTNGIYFIKVAINATSNNQIIKIIKEN